MSEMMDHLHNTHPQDNGEDISAIISSSAQTRMGIDSCPLCEVKGDADSPELIDHVLEHVHDFSLRSLPWPRSSEVDIGGEVGSFNLERGETVAITQWLEVYEHETEDIDPTLKLSTYDYGRLAIITEQIGSEGQDKLGLDIGFADEHGDESAEAETDISQLTQHTIDSAKEPKEECDLLCCLECSAEWFRDENGLTCPKCQSERVKIGEPKIDASRLSHSSDAVPLDLRPSISSARESTSGFRRLTDRLFSRKKSDNIETQQDHQVVKNLIKFQGLKQRAIENQKAGSILINLYQRRLRSLPKTESTFSDFIRDVQNEDAMLPFHYVSNQDRFLQVMVKFYLNPLKRLPTKDLTKPISNYFINSSHRTLLHTLSEPRSAYNAIQEMFYLGYRSIDLDVWNGDTESDLEVNQPGEARSGQATKTVSRLLGLTKVTNGLKPVAPKATVSQAAQLSSPTEPIVTDGYTLMTPCSFREACQVIRKSAFVSTDLPVIINLEVHADPGQQEIMVKIMKEEWHDSLIDEPLEGCDPRFRLPTLEDLRGRILVRLSTLTSPFLSNSGIPDNALHGESHHMPGRIPIIQPLAELGVYMRRERFENFNNPRTKSPTHLFSMQESKVQELLSTSPTDLFRHNQNYFFRVYPNSARQDSSNLDPLRFWRYGVQMAGIVRHNVDEGMMLNEGMFADESGWVLKPHGYRGSKMDFSTDLEAAPRKGLDLSIFAFQGQEFLTSTGREIKNLSSFMRVSLHINDEENVRLPRDGPISTDNDSGALGYELNFHVTAADATIIPKLSILR
ncbi:hypothetical protein ACKRZS_011636 [Fusarium odoratissimum]